MESLKIAEWIHDTSFEDIPTSTISVIKRALLDTLGVIMAANSLGEGCRPFVDLALEKGGKEESTIIGFGHRVPNHMAAFANGAMVHALDFEDAHDQAGVHPNAATIPAALALAESLENVPGKNFITALVLGSELVCRMGLSLTTNILEGGWYPPAILGAFGATAACAKLLNLSTDQILDALSLCLCQAVCSAEIINSARCLIRGVRDAFAAKTGILSSLLAKKGVRGVDRPLEGEFGFFALYAKGMYDPSVLLSNLKEKYECTNISFKPWPSCRGTHPYIEATMKIMKEYGVSVDEIRLIRVIISDKSVTKKLCEPLERKREPQTAIDAKFSIPFTVALAATYGDVRLESFTKEFLTKKEVIDMANKVEYAVDVSLHWRTSNPGIVEFELKDGRTIRKKIDFPYGHPENPIGFEGVISKFLECSTYAHKPPNERSLKQIIESVENLEELESIKDLTQHL